jgi:hypothetical protein
MKKLFMDYAPESPPQGWTMSYTGSLLAVLKLIGELPNVPWRIPIGLLVLGAIYTLIHTAIRKANATDKPPKCNEARAL